MFTKLRTLRTIDESGAVLIVRLPDADTAERVAHAAIEGGFRALEITLSIPGAVDLVHRLAAQYAAKGVAVGAGTVLDGHAAYECIRAGATFPEVLRLQKAPHRTSWAQLRSDRDDQGLRKASVAKELVNSGPVFGNP
jgi:2-dehydro-3-deoxyphosphogluconate aldolase/(4S)-4-hydroxy-2-oxoglutarate aldolase